MESSAHSESSTTAGPRVNPSAAAAAREQNRHMIDYHGRFRPEDGLGFDYDDVPY